MSTQETTQQMQLLTHSSMAAAKKCLRSYYYSHVMGLRPTTEADALRIGSVVHAALEQWHTTGEWDNVQAAIDEAYGNSEREYERMTLLALMDGYITYWGEHDIPFDTCEQEFRMPLRNPETTGVSRTFSLAGKIDGLAAFCVIEHKTTSESIASDSDYWLRLRVDPQLSMYVLAARSIGRDVGHVWYSVIRKPTIAPGNVPLLDDDGNKIVLDADGERVMTKQGKPRQTSDTKLGYVLQTRPETVCEWGDRLAADIASRPEYYYARREIPVLDDQLEEFKADVWAQSKLLIECQRNGYWFRTVNRWSCGSCDYAELCLHNVTVDPEAPPAGFEILENRHPELDETQGEKHHGITSTSNEDTPAACPGLAV